MTNTMLFAGALMFAIGTPAIAQQNPSVVERADVPDSGGAAERTITLLKSGKKLETVSCADFVALDENFYPQAVTYAANYGPKGNPHPAMTVSGVQTVVPEVVTTCKARPGDRFERTVKAALSRQGK